MCSAGLSSRFPAGDLDLQTEIVVHRSSGMSLHDEARGAGACAGAIRTRLRSVLEIATPLVLLQGIHRPSMMQSVRHRCMAIRGARASARRMQTAFFLSRSPPFDLVRPRSLLLSIVLLPWPAHAQSARSPDQQVPHQDDTVVVVVGEPLPPQDTSAFTQSIDRNVAASGRVENAVRDAGATQFRRSDARSAHPTSQGLTLRGLGGNAASRVLVVLDGVPQADPFGGWISWPGYDALPLAAVVLRRGGGTGAWGPGALAGTLELTTSPPRTDASFAGEILGGSRRSFVSRTYGSVPVGPVKNVIGASIERSDGYVPVAPEMRGPVDEPAAYQQAGAALRSEVDWGRWITVRSTARAFFDERSRGTVWSENHNEGLDVSLHAASANPRSTQWSALVYLQRRNLSSSFSSENDERDSVRQVLDQVRVPSTGLGMRISLEPDLGPQAKWEWGVDFRRVQGWTQERYLFVDGTPEREREAGGVNDTGGLFHDLSWRLHDRLVLSASSRLDLWRIHEGFRRERQISGDTLGTDDFDNRWGIEGTGRVGVGAYLTKAVHVRSAAYTGYRLPTLNELYRPFRVGADATAANASLDPERLWGSEVGIDLRPRKGIELSLTAFENHLLGAIANVTLDRGPGTFDGVGFVSEDGAYRQRRNLRAIRSLGLEAALEINDEFIPLPGVNFDAFYTFVRAEVQGSDESGQGPDEFRSLSGGVPAQVPEHTLTSILSWTDAPGGTTLSLTLRYLAAQFEDDLNLIALRDAWTWDASGDFLLADEVHALLRIENITDARVETAKDSSGLLELASPRTFWVGLSYGR